MQSPIEASSARRAVRARPAARPCVAGRGVALALGALLIGAAGTAAAAAANPPAAARDAVAAPAAVRVTDCDRLAAYPGDPHAVAPGVTRERMDVARAAEACEAAVAAEPGNARVRYQLARVLFYQQQNERAVREMRASADAGHAQAQFVFGTFVARGREAAPTDICLTERYWRRAAHGGRQAARVQYVRFALQGRFAGCAEQAPRAEMESLLATAAGEARDFYERLLIEDLTAALAAADAARFARGDERAGAARR